MALDRRSFLKLGLAAPAAALLPSVFAQAARRAAHGDRALVLLKLDGGNDGLNSVVPYAHDAYYRARPGLGIKRSDVLRLDDQVGLNPALADLRRIWDDGALTIVQGVGYPDPDRSHFRSSDIWETGHREPPERWSGWLGRALDAAPPGGGLPGLQLDPGTLSLALVAERIVVPSVRDAARFRVEGGAETLQRLERLATASSLGGAGAHVENAARASYQTARSLESALGDERHSRDYPGTELARNLWQIARLIEAGLEARVYAVRLSGFDTHARQRQAHDQLLGTVSAALGAFHADLHRARLAERVLVLVYSEFGRRVDENRSGGTDHGAAAPVLVLGRAAKGGLYGPHPDLSELARGDVVFHTDFRRVYATVLDRWLGVDAASILGAPYATVDFL